ncbi:hypothetical protein QEN19_002584 [Hanseniaspora menglaensis]
MKIPFFKKASILVTFLTFLNLLSLIDATILAIDYGKGFSKSSIIGAANPLDIVLSQDSKRKDVTGIMLRPDNKLESIERSYGSNLLNFQLRFPEYVVLGLKSLIGKTKITDIFSDFNSGLQTLYDDDVIKIDIGTKHKYSVEELVAMDFNHIIANAQQQFPNNKKVVLNGVNNQINDLVLSVPNYYKQKERLMLHDIVEISDFDRSLGYVDDNLATGISYIAKNYFKLESDVKTHFIVYDMGQESLKTSLFTAFKNSSALLNKDEVVDLTIELNGYGYDKSLGGDHITNDLKNLLINKFLDKNSNYKKNQLLSNSKFLNKIIQTAEKCKLVLSANSDYKIFVESIIDDVNFKSVISRKEFEDLVMKNYKDRILQPLVDVFTTSESIFNQQNVSLANISSIILTGGSTRIPFVQQVLVDYLGNDYYELLSKSVNSDESVTSGLAIRGVKLENSFKFKQNINVVDKLIYNYTLTANENTAIDVFSAGDSYPIKKMLNFSLDSFENDKEVSLILAEDNESFVEYIFKLNNVKKCDFDDAAVNVTVSIGNKKNFAIDKVESVCNGTASKISTLTINKYLGRQPLTKSEIRASKKHIKLLNEKDEQKILLTEALNLFESSLYEQRSFLEDVESNELPEELIETLQTCIGEYIEWLDYDSDGCTLQDIETKHLDISHQVSNIKNYQKSLTTSLDLNEFNSIFENITSWLEDLEALDDFYLAAVLNKTEKFTELNISESVLDVYNGTPLTKRLSLQNQTFVREIAELKEDFIPKLSLLLANFEKEDRLAKFELKLEFLNHLELMDEMLSFHEELFKYRYKFLEASIAKKQRLLLRQYEKSKLEKIKELGLKDKDGNLVEEVMEKAHKRAEAREKEDEDNFLRNTEDYIPNDDKEVVEDSKNHQSVEEELELDEL